MVHRINAQPGFLMENSKTEVIENKLGELQLDFMWFVPDMYVLPR